MTNPTPLESVERKILEEFENRQWFSIPAEISIIKSVEGLPQNDNGSYSIKTKPENLSKSISSALKKQREAIVELLPKEKDGRVMRENWQECEAEGFNMCLRTIKHLLVNNDKEV